MSDRNRFQIQPLALLLFLLFAACQSVDVSVEQATTPAQPALQALPSTSPSPPPATTQLQAIVEEASTPPPLPTARPTSTPPPEPTATQEPTATPTATPIGKCADRIPDDGLTTLVTAEYGISRDYTPGDLVSISSYLPVTVTLGYPTQLREVAVDPLVEMIDDMHMAGLEPTIISGYRSYYAQSVAWNKWLEQHPERASIISAPPGHSEHQLGTTIDFGSPELPVLVGEEDIEFHTNFYLTSEGIWLAEHAHQYGFVLSYPRETFELTGMYYEPWHYRFVGKELAEKLRQDGASLISYLLATEPAPCIP